MSTVDINFKDELVSVEDQNAYLVKRNKEMRKGIRHLFLLLAENDIDLPVNLWGLEEKYKADAL